MNMMLNLENYAYIDMIDDFFLLCITERAHEISLSVNIHSALFIEFNDFDHTLAGDPASGKGYRCPKIVEHLGFTDLCAGRLLEAETKSGSENG
ncbi:hypothetical protein OIU78_011574, partial [Salix suchowensis]